ncbi:cobalt ABC transporter ATPase [Neobacillus bataviensis LMG 21833]|uniref:Cobalt ABC transporter ATPase n=1 Tax=Neobacillus bataviensis LMG 21833 TaxID=1117379 RepID=K6CJQ2_9BACI|nr:ABC transporter ATP-binding protein [Neobacillus bataviensis]EKN71400.1 cobalt ABC transporter ATPase [Neobacillus bataviensis LMG 21833]
MDIFRFQHVSYGYTKDKPILRDISFSICEGRKTAIVGANGAGKSTVLFHLNGLYAQQQGDIFFHEQKLDKRVRKELYKHVGIVFQDPDDQLISLTVSDDIAFGPVQMDVTDDEVQERVAKYSKLVGIEHLLAENPSELSYGQKKHVTVAGVLAMETDVFILDEPMAFLDPLGKERMASILQLLQEQGKTVIVTTHDMQFVAEWAEDVIVIHQGQCLGLFQARDLFQRHDLMKQANLTLPPIVELMTAVWKGNKDEMPIRVEEAKKWLASKI